MGPNEVQAIQQRAEQGDLEAQNKLGNFYTNGNGVPQDFAQSFAWYQRAAARGFAPAQFNLGLAYELGRGVKADEKQAFKSYLLAAEQGFAAAQFNIGNMYAAGRGVGQDFFEANLWFKQAADKGVIEAQYNLGLVYEAGRGVKKDEASAARWYRTAAESGFARAQYNLGLLYEDGRGVKQDDAMAVQLYRAAAEQGFAPAQNNLGLMYAAGRGLSADPVTGYAWLALAVKNGANTQGLDFVGKSLSRAQIDQATRRMAELTGRSGTAKSPSVGAMPSSSPVGLSPSSADPQVNESGFARIQNDNAQLVAANQKLAGDQARLEQQVGQGEKESARLVEQLRGQSERLSGELQNMIADRESAALHANRIAAQLKGAEEELVRLKAAAPHADQPDELVKLRAQLAAANTRSEGADRTLAQLRTDNQRLQDEKKSLTPSPPTSSADSADQAALRRKIADLTGRLDANNNTVSELQRKNDELSDPAARLQRANDQVPSRSTVMAGAATSVAGGGDLAELNRRLDSQENVIRSLRADNLRLNDEVKSSTRELLALNQQARGPRVQSAHPGGQTTTPPTTASRQLDEQRLDNQRVSSNNTRLRNEREAAVNDADNYAVQLRDARNEVTRLTIEVQQLRGGRTGNESGGPSSEQAAVRMETLRAEAAQLTARNEDLSRQLTIARGRPTTDESARLLALDQQLASARADGARLTSELGSTANDRVLIEQLKGEKADLEKWAKSLEERVNDQKPIVVDNSRDAADWRTKLEAAQNQIGQTTFQLVNAEERRKELNRKKIAAEDRARKAEESLAASANAAEKRAARSEALLRQLGEDNARLSNEAKKTATDVVNLQRRLQDIASAPASANTTKALQDEVAAAEKTTTELRAQLARAQTDGARAANLVTENKNLATQLAKAREQSASAADLRSQLDRALAENRQLAESRSNLEQASDVVTQLTNERDTLVKDLAIARNDSVEVNSLREENDRLKRVADEALSKKRTLGQLTAENAHLKDLDAKAGANIEALSAQLAAARQSLDQSSTAQNTVATERDRLAQALAAAKLDSAQFASLRDENNRLKQAANEALSQRSRSEQLASENSRLTESATKEAVAGTALRQQLATLQQSLEQSKTGQASTAAERDRLANELAIANQAAAKLAAVRDENTLLRQTANATPLLRTQIDQLSEQLAQAKQQATALVATEQKFAEAVRASTDLQAELERAQSEGRAAAGLTRENQQLAAEIKKLKDAGANENAGLQSIRQQLAAANQSLDRAQGSAADLASANDRLEKELAASRPRALQVAALSEEVAKLRPLTSEVAALRQDNQQLERAAAESNNLRQQVDKLDKDNERLVSSAKAADSTQVASLRAENARLKEEADAARELSPQVAQLKTQLAQAQAATNSDLSAVATLQRQLGEVQLALATSGKSLAEAKAEKDFLAEQFAAAKRDAAQLGALRDENARLTTQLAQAQASGSSDSSAVATLQRQLGEVQLALATSGKSLAEAKAEKDFLAEQFAAAKRDAAQVAELRTQLDQLVSENRQLKTAAPREGADSADLRRQLAEAGQSAEQQRTTVAALTADIERLNRDLATSRQAPGGAGGLSDEGARFRQITAQVSTLRADNIRLERIANEARSARDNVGSSVADLGTERDRLARELAAAKVDGATLEALQVENEKLKLVSDEAVALRSQIGLLTAEATQAKQQLSAAAAASQQKIIAAEKLAADLRTQLEKNQAGSQRVTELASSVARLTAENKQLKDNAAKAAGPSVEALKSQLAAAQQSASKATSAAAAIAVERDRLAKELARAKKDGAQIGALRDEKAKLMLTAGASQAARSQADQLVAQVGSLKTAAAKSASDLEKLRNELTAAKQSSEKNLKSVNDLTAERDRLAKEVTTAKQNAGGAQLLRTQADQLTAQVEQLKSAGAQNAAEVEALRLQLRTANQSVAKNTGGLAAVLAERDRLTQELAAAKQTAGGSQLLGTQVDQLTAQVGQLKASEAKDSAEMEALRRDLAMQKRDLEATRDNLASVTFERDNLAKGVGNDETLRRELSAAQLTLEQSRKSLADTKAEKEFLATELTAVKRDAAQLAPLRDENNRLKQGAGSALQLRSRVAQLTEQLNQLQAAGAQDTDQVTALRRQLAESGQFLDHSQTAVAELTGLNERLEKDLVSAKKLATEAGDELAKKRQESAQIATLRSDNLRLERAAAETTNLRAQVDQLTRENQRLAAESPPMQRELDTARSLASDLQKQLESARAFNSGTEEDARRLQTQLAQVRQDSQQRASEVATLRTQLEQARTTGASANLDELRKLRLEMAEANAAMEKQNAAIADLTGANDRLEKDLDNSKKSLGAALAAQSQAVNANQSDAYKMEIRTLQDRVKQVEAILEEDRSAAAREISTIANQLQKSRETNQSLVAANRSLVNAQRADDTVSRSDFEQVQAQVRDLTSAADELRRQNQRATDEAQRNAAENQRIVGEREGLKSMLADARKVATTLPGLADEKAALEERVTTGSAEVARLQGLNEQLRRQNSDTSELALLMRQAADRTQSELAALRLRLAEAEKVSDTQNSTTSELTSVNQKLEQERSDLRRQLDAAKAETTRLAQAQQSASQAQQSAEQLRTEAERNALQSVDAVTAQMAQLRRDVDSLRATNARLTEANATQDRDRQAVLGQLRAENTALNNRLTQAQGTLDQIASAARLGTPASSFAGGTITQAPAQVPVAQQRFHTVTDGDSLSRISLRYYGTANRWQEIYNANRDVLQGSSTLRVGQQLRIP